MDEFTIHQQFVSQTGKHGKNVYQTDFFFVSNSDDLIKRTIFALINSLFLDWFTGSPLHVQYH